VKPVVAATELHNEIAWNREVLKRGVVDEAHRVLAVVRVGPFDADHAIGELRHSHAVVEPGLPGRLGDVEIAVHDVSRDVAGHQLARLEGFYVKSFAKVNHGTPA
jgi:hypothetical protein